jgi:hypothetical protein
MSLAACDHGTNQQLATASAIPLSPVPSAQTPMMTIGVTSSPATLAPTQPSTAIPLQNCAYGTGLRAETVDSLLKYKDRIGMVMSASSNLAAVYFPQFGSAIKVIGAPSLEILHDKSLRAGEDQVPYDALGYGLETSESTPEEEWRDLLGSTQKVRALADGENKLLLMAPGFKLMASNEGLYEQMAALSDIWMLQTQQLQKSPPGQAYRDEVARIVNLIRSGNPDIIIWAQITLPPDRKLDAEQWKEYYRSIMDLVDGAYIGIYTWEDFKQEDLINTMESIFETACINDQ